MQPSPPARLAAESRFKLSCKTCRSKKIKCNRVHPCTNCTKAAVECVFPERKRMQRPRKTKNQELLNRISRLETIVGKVDAQSLKNLNIDISDIGLAATSPGPAPNSAESQAVPHETQPCPDALPETSAGVPTPRYLGVDFWSSLSHEVEGLKQALEQTSDPDSESESDVESPESAATQNQNPSPFATQGLLPGFPSPDPGGFVHPISAHVLYLLSVYLERVDPILKVLHRPTILAMLPTEIPRLTLSQEALAFSIYFAAITSLSSAACLANLGQDRAALVKTYQIAVERALVAADYLNSTEIECLQALLLYVACLRVHNNSRASWALTALLLRLGQGAGLLRDGEGRGYTPYEVEMRRRLFWHIVILDVRASEDRGTEAMIYPGILNSRQPLNINDDDFGPESTGPLTEREGVTDITFSLCMMRSSDIFLWVAHMQSAQTSTPQQTEDDVIRRAQRLESEFVTNADPTKLQSYMASGLVRLINLKVWMLLQYPMQVPVKPTVTSEAGRNLPEPQKPRWPRVSRETMLQTCTSILELAEYFLRGPRVERFGWWSNTYVQWHPLAVCLAELCRQTQGLLVDRAWKAVDQVYPLWAKIVADTRRGQLWRPIRKLHKKARAARMQALREDSGAVGRGPDSVIWMPAPWMPAADMNVPMGETPMVTTAPDTAACVPARPDAAAMDASVTGAPWDINMMNLETSGFVPDSSLNWPNADADAGPVAAGPGHGEFDFGNWGVWNEFLDDTFADYRSRTASTEDNS